MKHRKVKFPFLTLLLSAAFIAFSLPSTSKTVTAGVVQNDVAMVKTVTNKSDWRASDGVSFSNSGIRFSASLVSARAIRNEKLNDYKVFGIEKCFDAQISLRISELPSDRKFGFAFGLPYISNTVGTPGSSLFYFSVSGETICCGLDYYNEKELAQTVIEEMPVYGATLGDTLSAEISVFNDGSVRAKVGKNNSAEKTELTCASNDFVSGNGYCGFGQLGGEGNTEAEISSAVIGSYRYETPENMTYAEDFSDNTYNMDFFAGGSIGDSGETTVSDNKLIFKNVNAAFLSSRYDYSNAVVDIDLLQEKKSAPVTIAFGAKSCDVADRSPALLVEIGQREDGAFAVAFKTKNGSSFVGLPLKYDLLNAQNENGQVLNIRVYCVDGKVRVLMKYSDEIGFSEVAVFSLENHTPNGKIQIQAYSSGERLADFALGYVGVGNLDYNGNEVPVTYQSSDLFVPTDYDYKDSWNREDLPFHGVK